jgi:hypothetical protein
VSASSRTRVSICTKPSGVAALFPTSGYAASTQRLDPAEPGDRLYRFEALEIKELSQRLGGVLWPCGAEAPRSAGLPPSPWQRRPTASCSSSPRVEHRIVALPLEQLEALAASLGTNL